MTEGSQNESASHGNFSAGYLFGVPVGDLGFFASLLVSFASAFIAFFASTFLAIFGVLFYNTALHGSVDFALTYRRAGLPVGLTVLAIALAYTGTLWVRRKIRRT
jgi:hypothetical protein